jgi:hypothetical protein
MNVLQTMHTHAEYEDSLQSTWLAAFGVKRKVLLLFYPVDLQICVKLQDLAW